MIKVYSPDERIFDNNGIKILKPIKAQIYKADNSDYYLEIEDNISNLQYYQKDYIIRVPSPWGYQGFVVGNPKIKNNRISVKCWHLFYLSSRYVISDSYVVDKNCNDALDHLNNACDQESPFTTISDIPDINSYRCVRKSLEEAVKTTIEKWGGHLDRDNFNIAIKSKIGQDRGVVLAANKNISNIEVEENWDNVITKVLPVGKDGLKLPEEYLLADLSYEIPYTKVIEFNQNIDQSNYSTESEYKQALENDLREQALKYLNENKIPKVNYVLSAHITQVADVGDIIYVKHPKCNVNITTNVISVVYDVLSQKYKKIEFGNFKKTLNNLMTEVKNVSTITATEKTEETKLILSDELQKSTAEIWSTLGDYEAIFDGNKILFLDKLPKEEAKNVLMISGAGIGFSTTGIYGTFNSAWTIDGTLDMQKINVINLVADMIKGGTLKLGSAENQDGILELYDASNTLIGLLNKDGLTMYAKNGDYVKINAIDGFAGYNKEQKIYWADGDEFHMRKAVVETEITFVDVARFIKVDNGVNKGIGIVSF